MIPLEILILPNKEFTNSRSLFITLRLIIRKYFSFIHYNYKKFIALPYSLSTTAAQEHENPKISQHFLAPGYIKDAEHIVFSNAFIIKYWEEEVELGNVVQFRTELDNGPSSEKTEFFLDVEMRFLEMKALGGYEFALSMFAADSMSVLENLRTVSKRTYKLTGPANDVFSGYVQTIFDEYHYSSLHLSIHSTILEFKLRQIPLINQTSEANETEDEPIVKIISLKSQPEKIQQEPNELIAYKPKLDLATFFFGDLDGLLPGLVSAEDADEVYDDYVSVLHRIKAKLESKLIDMSQKGLEGMAPKKIGSKKAKYLEDSKDEKENLKVDIQKVDLHLEEISHKNETPSPSKKLRFSETLKSLTPSEITKELTQELNKVSGDILNIWFKYMDLLKCSPKRIMKNLSSDFQRMLNESFSYFIFPTIVETDGKPLKFRNIGDQHKDQFIKMHSSNFFGSLQALPVHDQTVFVKAEDTPIFFEEHYVNKATAIKIPSSKTGVISQVINNQHLIVLVHGFGASSYDMRLLKNYLELLHPDAFFLCSAENESKTEGDIYEMGTNLADEVRGFIFKNSLSRLGKITFIGHSLGGVIIRTALPLLEEYKEKMHALITLSSPHLGYMFQTSSLVNAGMWVIKTWQKSKCLDQLMLTDNKEITHCLLYKLAFSKVFFF